MIFYGTNASRLKDGRLNNVTCPNCNNDTAMNYSVFGKYAYLYWIPVFPIGKENVLECNSCNKTYNLNELPDQIKRKFETEKHTGLPLQHFAGFTALWRNGLVFVAFRSIHLHESSGKSSRYSTSLDFYF